MDPWLILFGFGVGPLILVFGIKPVVAVGSDLALARTEP
jgi:hypothetical protein